MNDVVLSRRCNPGETAFVSHNDEFALGQNLVLLRADGTRIYPPFLRWLVRGGEWWDQVRRFLNVGAVFDSLKCADIPRFELSIPPIGEQRVIADILGVLDDKIELNRRMNETLEAMARALFKDWFIDFGPVLAKAEGRQPPGLAPEIAALFPDALDDENMPMGWVSLPLLNVARLISGGTPKTNVREYWDGSIPWASAKDVSQCNEPFLVETERTITNRGLAESATRIVSRFSTVVIARGATTGRFCSIGRDMAMNQTCYALTSVDERPFWLRCAFGEAVDALVHAAHGSVFDTITTRTIESARVAWGGSRIHDAFEDLVRPVFLKALQNIEERATLGALRDLLLPKLLSGEIRVKDAERAVEAVA